MTLVRLLCLMLSADAFAFSAGMWTHTAITTGDPLHWASAILSLIASLTLIPLTIKEATADVLRAIIVKAMREGRVRIVEEDEE